MPPHPLRRKLQFVTGKGGVGKSLISAAIALKLAREGRRVLLYQVHATDAHAAMLEVLPIGPDLREVLPDLFAVNTNPEAALREYGLLKLKWKTVYNAVFENRLIKYFLRFVPSLAELNMLGKAWYHLEAAEAEQRFDHVIIDAPSTGHGLTFVRVARVVARGATAGPLRNEAEAMARTIENPELCALHLVCLPEQMPVDETLELVSQVRALKAAPLGVAVVNRMGPRFFAPEDGEVLMKRAAREGERQNCWQLAQVRWGREQAKLLQRDRLASVLDLPLACVESYAQPVRQRELVEQIGDQLFTQLEKQADTHARGEAPA